MTSQHEKKMKKNKGGMIKIRHYNDSSLRKTTCSHPLRLSKASIAQSYQKWHSQNSSSTCAKCQIILHNNVYFFLLLRHQLGPMEVMSMKVAGADWLLLLLLVVADGRIKSAFDAVITLDALIMQYAFTHF